MREDYTLGKVPYRNYELTDCPAIVRKEHVDLSPEFYQRALSFYKRQKTPVLSEIWTGMHTSVLKPLVIALENGDEAALRSAMEKLYDSGVTLGIDPPNEHLNSELFRDLFVGLSNGLGTLPVLDSVKSVAFKDAFKESEYEYSVHWPGRLGGISGWDYKGNFIPAKMMEAVLVLAIMDRICITTHVLEIGAGCGFVGYCVLNEHPMAQYHTVDLPVVSVLQAFMLASALDELSIVFEGETHAGDVFIHGPNLPPGEFDVCINVNSLPEVERETAMVYLKYIRDRCDWFISVNHESGDQVCVSDSARRIGMKLLCRSPWWLRENYVQEIFRINRVRTD